MGKKYLKVLIMLIAVITFAGKSNVSTQAKELKSEVLNGIKGTSF